MGESQLSLFQRGAIPTVIGCIAGAGIILGLEIVQDPLPLGICLSLVGVSIFSHIPGWILILLGALVRSGIGSVIEKM